MKKLVLLSFITITFFACKNTSEITHEEFLKNQNLSAKEYILGLFETHDIVLLCERNHKEVTQYDLIYDIVSDLILLKM